MNPLTFSYRPLLRTNIGKKNLRNLIELGVDHIDYSIIKKEETYFLKRSFYKFGAVGIPMHMAMWGIASYLAKSYKIKYILWGENSAHEYSGTKSNLKLKYLNEKWIKKFGINFNTTIKDWYDKFLNQKNTIPFKRINNSNIKSIFLGDFFKWDPDQILRISQKLGFQSSKQAKTGIYNYADLDDDLISVHHFLKVYKYGFTRTFDNLSIEIRKGRINRKKAIKIARKSINKIPHNDIRKFCKLIKISKTEFFKVCEKFRNKKIWLKKNKKWELKYPII